MEISKLTQLLMMEYMYVNTFNDSSKRGFVVDQMKTNIFTDDALFETVLDEFKTACLDNQEYVSISSMVINLDNLEIKNQFIELLKSIIPEEFIIDYFKLI